MEFTEQVIKDINKCVEDIADDYYQTKQYDEEGHAFEMRWDDCINHGVDDFMKDPKAYMDCFGYELTDDEAEQCARYAWDNVNLETIKNYA